VVGGTFATTTIPSATFAYQQKKKVGQDGGSKNGNTITIEECKDKGELDLFQQHQHQSQLQQP
jgi:hypothetical protein